MVREIALQMSQRPLAGHSTHRALTADARVQLVVGRFAVLVGRLAPTDTRVLFVDELVEPREAEVRVGVEGIFQKASRSSRVRSCPRSSWSVYMSLVPYADLLNPGRLLPVRTRASSCCMIVRKMLCNT